MRVHGRAVVLFVAPFRAQASTEKSIAPGRVDEIRGLPGLGAPVIVHGLHACAPAAVQELDIAGPAAFDDLGAAGRRAPDEDFVEFGAPDLIGEGQGFVPAVREFEFLAPAVPRRNEFRAPFLHADGMHLLRHAETLEQGQIGGQKRLTDVKSRVAGLFQDHHAVTLLGEQNRRSRTGRTAADDQYVASSRRCVRPRGRGNLRDSLGHLKLVSMAPAGQPGRPFDSAAYRADEHRFNAC